MPEQQGVPDEFVELVAAACNGTLTDDQLKKLEKFLTGDETCQQFYIDYLRLDAELSVHGQHQRAEAIINEIEQTKLAQGAQRVSICDSPNPSIATRVYCFFAKPTPLSMTVATLVLGILLTAMAFMAPPFYRALIKGGGRDQPAAPHLVGWLSGEHETTWESPEAKVGLRLLNNQTLELHEGVAQLSLRNGVRLIVEGPARWTLDSKDHISLAHGSLVAYVPEEAIGFTVAGKEFEVRDLGTEFAVEVPSAKRADEDTTVNVFTGLVELMVQRRDAPAIVRQIAAGKAIRIRSSNGELVEENAADERFIRELPKESPPIDNRYEQLILASRPLAYWPLSERSAAKVALDRSGHRRNGTVAGGVAFADDGPAGSRCATFDGSGLIETGAQPALGRTSDFTIEAWIWIDDADHHGRIIVADPPIGAGFGWDLTYSPAIGPLASRNKRNCLKFTFLGARSYHFEEAEVNASKWHHIALVANSDANLSLFIDGKQRQTLPVTKPGRTGPTHVTIGRATGKRAHVAYWIGRLAHVAFYDRALTATEIKNHFVGIANAKTPNN